MVWRSYANLRSSATGLQHVVRHTPSQGGNTQPSSATLQKNAWALGATGRPKKAETEQPPTRNYALTHVARAVQWLILRLSTPNTSVPTTTPGPEVQDELTVRSVRSSLDGTASAPPSAAQHVSCRSLTSPELPSWVYIAKPPSQPLPRKGSNTP